MNWEMPLPDLGETVMYQRPGDRAVPLYVNGFSTNTISGVCFVPGNPIPTPITAVRHKDDPNKSPNDPTGIWYFREGRKVPTEQIVVELKALEKRLLALEMRVKDMGDEYRATKEANAQFVAKLEDKIADLEGAAA